MNRRSFLRTALSAAAASAVLDPDKLLWIPGAKSFSFPAARDLEFEARTYQIDAICRMFRVDPEMVLGQLPAIFVRNEIAMNKFVQEASQAWVDQLAHLRVLICNNSRFPKL